MGTKVHLLLRKSRLIIFHRNVLEHKRKTKISSTMSQQQAKNPSFLTTRTITTITTIRILIIPMKQLNLKRHQKRNIFPLQPGKNLIMNMLLNLLQLLLPTSTTQLKKLSLTIAVTLQTHNLPLFSNL